jgi:iron complex outermembrane recepter protein
MRRSGKFIVSVASVLSTLGVSSVAWAQEAPATEEASGLGEIVVTAQKRQQSVQDVGISITAIGGPQLTQLQLTNSVDIARASSNVSVSGSYGGQMSQFTIRGVTQNDFNDHVESVVAIYVDDAYVAMAQGQTFGMFDLDHVEVLKGPQGTLFGRNATAGLVHFITKKPTDHLDGYVDVTYGSYNNVRLEGAIGGPIAGELKGRLSGFYERYDGWIKNKYPEQTFVPAAYQPGLQSVTLPGAGADLGGVKGQFALRGQVEADVSDSVNFWGSAFYTKMVASTGPYQDIATVAVLDAAGNHVNTIYASPTQTCQVIQNGGCVHAGYAPGDPNSTTRPVPGGDFFGYRDPDGSGPITSADYAFDDANRASSYGVNGKLTIDLGGVTLTSLSDYKHFTKRFSLDLEAGPENQFFWLGTSKEDAFSQEIRLDGKMGDLTWVGGGYFLYINNKSEHGIGALPDSAYSFPSWDQPRMAELKSKSYSLFGQIEYPITPALTAIGGVRASREVKDYRFEVLFVTPTDGLNPYDWDFEPTAQVPGFYQDPYYAHSTETLWNWKAQLNWSANRDILLYAGVTQGAKAGSFNAGGPPLPENEIPYKPERLVSYEAGIKSEFFGRRLRINAAAFYYDYHNYQAARWLGSSGLIVNADAYIYGGELELTASPTNNLELSFNAGYQQNKVKDVPVAGGLRDVHTTFAPKWTLSGYVRYTVPTEIAGGKLALQASSNYQSSIYHNISNFDAHKYPGWAIVNALVEWVDPSEKFHVSVFGNNLFNKHYDTIGFDLSQISGSTMTAQGKPRWIGARVRYDF